MNSFKYVYAHTCTRTHCVS